jgi:acyl-CoA reductase-like NAD-dependent aldehyde dehydrogenase
VFVLPGALRERGESIASGLYTSFTLGAGQFCTKPGMVFLPADSAVQGFGKKLQELVLGSAEFRLLTPSIRSSYLSAIAGARNKPP